MKKILLLLSVIICSFSVLEKDIYALHFKSLDKEDISMSSYKGKKILIVEFNAGNPDRRQLRALDTLFRQIKTYLVVVAVPVEDFGTAMPEKSLVKLLRDSLGLGYPVAAVSKAKKNKGTDQHTLLQWLTDKANNKHFDTDVEEDGQMYLVSETGVLYASVKKSISPTGRIFKNLLGQQVPE